VNLICEDLMMVNIFPVEAKSIVICTTQRTGSTLLCEQMKRTGV
jgi:hypothetical protein